MRKHKCLMVIIIAAVVVHCYAITRLPYGLHVDEIGMAYDAWCLANYGVDRWLQSWPVYLNNYGLGQSALYAYLCVPLMKLFGANVVTIRMPAIVFSLMTLIFGLKIVSKLWKDERALVTFSILYLISPYFLMAGRFGLDCNLMLGMSTAFFYFFMKAIDSQRYCDFVIAGIVCGLILYTYALSYLLVPLFLLAALIYLLGFRKINFRQIIVLGIPIFLLALPLMLVQYVNITGQEAMHIGLFTITRLDSYRGGEFYWPRWFNFVRALKSIFLDDGLEYNTLAQYGTMYKISIPFCILGFAITLYRVVRDAWRKQWNPEVLFIVWCGAELLLGSMLMGNGPNANKLNGIFFVLLYFVMIGLLQILDWRVLWKRIASIVVASIYVVCSVSFFRYYFVTQAVEEKVNYLFYPMITDAVDYIESEEELEDKTVYIVNGIMPYVDFLLSTKTSPYDFDMETNKVSGYENYVFGYSDGVDEDACYIFLKPTEKDENSETKTLEELLDEAGFQTVEFEGYYLMY